MRICLALLFLVATSVHQLGTAVEPIYLGFLRDPFSIARSAPPPDLFGAWEHKIASPDGDARVVISVERGPGNLAVAKIRTHGENNASMKFEFELSLSFYHVNETLVAIVTKHTTVSDSPLVGTLMLTPFQLVKIEADTTEMKVRLPIRSALQQIRGTTIVMHEQAVSSFLLVGRGSSVEDALVESISSEWFSRDPVVVFFRGK